eukprot:gene8815-10449_t
MGEDSAASNQGHSHLALEYLQMTLEGRRLGMRAKGVLVLQTSSVDSVLAQLHRIPGPGWAGTGVSMVAPNTAPACAGGGTLPPKLKAGPEGEGAPKVDDGVSAAAPKLNGAAAGALAGALVDPNGNIAGAGDAALPPNPNPPGAAGASVALLPPKLNACGVPVIIELQ